MTKEKLFLLDALQGFIHGEKLNLDTELDWDLLQALAQSHSVSGILGCMTMQSPEACPEQLRSKLKKLCLETVGVFTRRTEKADAVIEKLSEAGIDHMLFKGYVVRNYYPVPELRTYGDIDILIKPQDRKRCHALMQQLGYAVKNDWEPVYSYYNNFELYEIHTQMLETDVPGKDECSEYFKSAWDNAQCTHGHTYEPKPEFHFIYLLTHIAKHLSGSGAGVRMYMDLAVFIERFKDGTDWEYIDRTLKRLGLREFADAALTVVEKCFKVESPIKLNRLPDETLEQFLDYTMDGGSFGHVGRDSALITLKNSERSGRAATLMRRVFPPAETLERRYTYLQGRKWLLPVAWVDRVFKNRSIWSQRAEEAKRIFQTDDREVEKLKSIYKQIGL